ncbi:DUF4440 domain-containing protein [Rouxiella silvae]|jgi:hypothetical protein|uniref:DUF4440 domain-containing protein n=1 Tax=Rouxiella silvae TaxID=1646373 RepID=A0ABX3U1W3_9GAMM|nr:hypothetical protein [Rouxiella silvae]KQN47519.1 cytoplasmic protein [Serratia sp. Leaf50]ORJ21370.1 DUF4440 domain-containing protein [Rouxiella silvae]
MLHTNPYFNEVIEAHRLIEQWLGEGEVPEEVCDRLITRFSEQYSMIGVAGNALDFAGLSRFFRANGSAKSGLEIEVFDLRTVAEWPTGAVVSYQEKQRLADITTLRYSTAVFERTAQGNIVWRHLHETSSAL